MKKELQDYVWAILPNGFKSEVKEAYNMPSNSIHDKGYNHALEYFFGEHNLTSDDETNAIFSKVDKIGIDCEKGQVEPMFKVKNQIKDSNVENNIRLQVATSAMQGILCNPNIIMSCGCLEDKQKYITRQAVMYADALISETNGKGGGDEQNNH